MAYDDYQRIRITVGDGICRATIDNPPINLLNAELIVELGRFAAEVAADNDVRVVVVDSADPAFFIAHADLNLIQGLPADDTTLHDELSPFNAVVDLFRTMPKATIAVIEGIARGGGSELAMAFDMRFAALGKALPSSTRWRHASHRFHQTSLPRPSGRWTPQSAISPSGCASRTRCSAKRSRARPPRNACKRFSTTAARPAR
jgi:1,4-dihydroxy-2-naphthoyl-CoA synthase